MPASMMSADTGGSVKVIGSSIAIVADGPMPGSTPINVPTITPMKQYHVFWRLRATLKPSVRWGKCCAKNSISPSSLPGPQRERQSQPVHEQRDGERDQYGGQEDHFLPAERLPAQGTDDDQDRARHDQSERTKQRAEETHAGEDDRERPQVHARHRIARDEERLEHYDQAENQEQTPDHGRKIRGAHAHRAAHVVVP